MQWSLASALDNVGWPLHLRSMEAANWQLEVGAAWAPADQRALMVLSAHEVEIDDIAQSFFEGRTAEECEAMLDKLKAGLPIDSIEGRGMLRHDDHQISETGPTMTAIAKDDSQAPTGTSVATTPFTKRLIEVVSSKSRTRSDTSHKDSRKGWDQADRDVLWHATQQGLSPRQIQAQCLPFRSESAIQTRMSKERAFRSELKIARKTVPSNSTPKNLPQKTPPSIATLRNRLLNSINAKYLSPDQKKELKKALTRTSWPTRFMSLEENSAPLLKNGARWTEQDTKALGCIRKTVPLLPYKLICKFFPDRSEAALRHQYNTKVTPGQDSDGH